MLLMAGKLIRSGAEGSEVEDARVQEARRRYARSLIGHWSTAQGTFDNVISQHWEFCPNGSGRFTDIGPFGYLRAETWFEWRQVGECEVELRITEHIAHHPDYAAELDDEERQWQVIRYDFVLVQHDMGRDVGLVGDLLSMNAPLKYCGSIASSVGAE